jgi:hypothetical protein
MEVRFESFRDGPTGAWQPVSPLELRAPAVDGELDTRDVGGIVRGEECHRCCDFFRFAEPFRRSESRPSAQPLTVGETRRKRNFHRRLGLRI